MVTAPKGRRFQFANRHQGRADGTSKKRIPVRCMNRAIRGFTREYILACYCDAFSLPPCPHECYPQVDCDRKENQGCADDRPAGTDVPQKEGDAGRKKEERDDGG